jgi:SAM-dependent methyltransferase
MPRTSTAPLSGSAGRHGTAWGWRARAWAENEEQQVPTYEAALRRVPPAPGDRVLDIGCGTGVFLRLAADRGARVSGVDASAALLEIARERVPDAELRVADMQRLPHPDDAFDLVTGFNAFFFADDMVAALAEARRVARPGGTVVAQVWGAPDRCDMTAMKMALRALAPPPDDTAPAPRLWAPGVLEELAAAAGLTPVESFDIAYDWAYPDRETLCRRLIAPGPVAELVRAVGEERVREAIVAALAPYRRPDGGYRVRNEWRYLVASA